VAKSGEDVIGEDVYIIGVWAVAICTVVGPIAFSCIVRRKAQVVLDGEWGTPSEANTVA
jgi:hypothetical protein